LKIALPEQAYSYITDDTRSCDADTAFVRTTQNSDYCKEASECGCNTIVDIEEVATMLGSKKIKIIGITGTNGKTTTAAAIYSFLLDLGYKCSLLGTRGFFINEERVDEKSLTTPPILKTLTYIYQAVEEQCEYFVMEVSSHAIVQKRIETLKFALKIHTNITGDHLDFHKTLEEYIAVKNSFFADDGMKLINKDDKNVDFNYRNAYTYSIESGGSFSTKAYSLTEGISFMMQHFQDTYEVHSPLRGFFNIYNLLAAVSAVKLLTKEPLENIAEVVENFAGVSGRMEVVSEDPLVIVDFAHTDDGMEQVLSSLTNKEIVVVFGAGGDRDRTKRAKMGTVASKYAKTIIVTSDNPRTEDPQKIADDIVEGIVNKESLIVNLNRKEAIKTALDIQKKGEVVMILGKGDETTQIIYDKTFPFDDREVVKEILEIKNR